MTMPAPSSISRVVRIHGRRMSAISRGERRSSSEASEPASRKMSSDASSPRTSITSSTLMVPSRRRSRSVTGTETRSYLATSRATSSWSVSGDTLTTLGSRMAHSGGLAHRHRVGRHEPPRGVLGILEQLLNVLGLLLLHHLEQAFRLRGGELLDDLGRVIRRHLVEDPRDLELIEGLHELQQRLIVELREDLARALRGEQPEHGHLRLERQIA